MANTKVKTQSGSQAASAPATAGSAGSEGLSGAPLILEDLLRNASLSNGEDVREAFHEAWESETVGSRLARLLREAFAIVADGHVHVGLIYPESRAFIEPALTSAQELAVVYEYGAAWIHAGPPGSAPTIRSRDDRTVWDFVAEHPTTIRTVSVYVLENGRLKTLCTKPARGYYDQEEHT